MCKLTLSHAELSSVGDTGGQVLAHLGVGGHQPRLSVEQLSVELLYVRGLDRISHDRVSVRSRSVKGVKLGLTWYARD